MWKKRQRKIRVLVEGVLPGHWKVAFSDTGKVRGYLIRSNFTIEGRSTVRAIAVKEP